MKKLLLILLAVTLGPRLFAQQYAQYNTGTLYESFENPAQKAFIVDSSRKIALNLFIPNFQANLYMTGNVQAALKSRAFTGRYDTTSLKLNQGQLNRANLNFSSYFFMFKLFQGIDGNRELGFFGQTKGEARGIFADDVVQVIDDYTRFNSTDYDNIANSAFQYQLYHQIGMTYRESVTKQLSFGIKLGFLMGVVYNKVNIYNSHITFDRPNDRAYVSLAGDYHASFEPGNFTRHDLLPTFKNPGAALSFGIAYKTENSTYLQFNLKDLGFISWNKRSAVGQFDNTGIVDGLSLAGREDSVFRTASSIVQSGSTQRSFTTPTNGKFEVSASKTFYPSDDKYLKYIPTAILSKELFYNGFTGALVNHLQYKNVMGTVSGSYNDLKQFNLGLQLMIKSPNAEFFIGSERLTQSVSLASAASNDQSPSISRISRYSGADFYLGFSLKMGHVIERRENASTIPMGEHKTFVRRFWERITNNPYQ